MCGGTAAWTVVPTRAWGLSPRVRGNRNCRYPGAQSTGSIPACAGEPRTKWESVCPFEVYPRVCGGTTVSHVEIYPFCGLSPRVRGNRSGATSIRPTPRSIPACAGEPSTAENAPGAIRVYPRVCGGTGRAQHIVQPRRGLSPRVRGNLRQANPDVERLRSIPACAGEPLRYPQLPQNRKVYPRVCGGTSRPYRYPECGLGLSPRVRGNHRFPSVARSIDRSIPACAGEPPPCLELR